MAVDERGRMCLHDLVRAYDEAGLPLPTAPALAYAVHLATGAELTSRQAHTIARAAGYELPIARRTGARLTAGEETLLLELNEQHGVTHVELATRFGLSTGLVWRAITRARRARKKAEKMGNVLNANGHAKLKKSQHPVADRLRKMNRHLALSMSIREMVASGVEVGVRSNGIERMRTPAESLCDADDHDKKAVELFNGLVLGLTVNLAARLDRGEVRIAETAPGQFTLVGPENEAEPT